MDIEMPSLFRAALEDFRWDGIAHMPYKQDGTAPFKDISRQVLFHEDSLGCELRYFEMDAAGYSTLERHEHMHAVMILRGHGACLLGDEIRAVKPHDLVTIPAWTWHQFRANAGEKMGFLCMVNVQRDRPQLPTEEELAAMKRNPAVADFLNRDHLKPMVRGRESHS
ncbi:cupin domain-containing protein [Rhodopila sp.]|jgi:mannose-6-phosphate isomerase-like protein (cupin superfamily)|uniref:cupin domain-containing protein n=1 Tax=Rhodopila sp. TaxID=2480087 RepID=UPI002C44663B|nr:cupin domain-containing protein [Rhodopila sp.]HVZ09786.1 cupin domain-containing protein [Rhodopila sp.]